MTDLTPERVTDWIAQVDDATIDIVLAALQARHEALHEARAVQATIGANVVISDVDCDALDGLDGEVVATDEDEGEVSVLLSAYSTGSLRFDRTSPYRPGVESRYVVHGIPAGCCWPAEAVSKSA